MHDLVVVGSGPAGSRLAARAAEAGRRTLLVEEHEEVGRPVHCTGIVGEEMLRRFELPPQLWGDQLSRFEVLSPKGVRRALPGVKAWRLDRLELDRYLARRAVEAGAELLLGTRVEAVEPEACHVVVRLGQGSLKARAVVLATGAMSTLPERSGLRAPGCFYQAAQVQAEVQGLQGVELYLGREVAPGSFAYGVPAGLEGARLGVLSRSGAAGLLRRLLEGLQEQGRLDRVPEPVACRRIPMGVALRSVRGRVLSVGDAAGQAKTTTGGGLHFGLVCSDLLAGVLEEAWRGGDFQVAGLAAYDRLWKANFRAELRAGVLVRRIFEQVEDRDLEELLLLLERPEVGQAIAREGDFDCHLPFLASLSRLPAVRKAALALAGRRFPGAALLGSLCTGPDRGDGPKSWRNALTCR